MQGIEKNKLLHLPGKAAIDLFEIVDVEYQEVSQSSPLSFSPLPSSLLNSLIPSFLPHRQLARQLLR